MQFVFFISIFLIAYVYIGYPFCAFFLAVLKQKTIDKHNSYQPDITILIAAYNEEKNIEETIKNKLTQDYPVEKVQIIIISDESTDSTDDIVNKFESKRIKLLRQKPRAGKTSALNLGIKSASGEIIFFSDANSIWDKKVLKMLVRNFYDPKIGYVTGKMIYTNLDGTPIGDGCSTYMKYENKLREWETGISSIVGVDGGVDGVRKELYTSLNNDQLPDFVQPLKVVEKGYRVIYEPEAILKEATLKEAEDEYRMRVRVSLRALWALKDMQQLLRCKSGCMFAWQLWSHKVLRYHCFLFLFAAFFSNLSLLASPMYAFLFGMQIVGYIGAAISPILVKKGLQVNLLYLLNYFALVNLASAHAFFKFLRGEKQVIWSPRKG